MANLKWKTTKLKVRCLQNVAKYVFCLPEHTGKKEKIITKYFDKNTKIVREK